MTEVYRADRPGQALLIPADWRGRMQREGYRITDAPTGTPAVTAPTPIDQIGAGAACASPSTAVTPAAPAPLPKRRRGRPKGSKNRRAKALSTD